MLIRLMLFIALFCLWCLVLCIHVIILTHIHHRWNICFFLVFTISIICRPPTHTQTNKTKKHRKDDLLSWFLLPLLFILILLLILSHTASEYVIDEHCIDVVCKFAWFQIQRDKLWFIFKFWFTKEIWDTVFSYSYMVRPLLSLLLDLFGKLLPLLNRPLSLILPIVTHCELKESRLYWVCCFSLLHVFRAPFTLFSYVCLCTSYAVFISSGNRMKSGICC